MFFLEEETQFWGLMIAEALGPPAQNLLYISAASCTIFMVFLLFFHFFR